MRGLIRWDVLSELLAPPCMPGPGIWDRFASKYDGFARLETDFTQHQVEALRLDGSETVLDIGAGPGRITIPAAKRARHVTALDGSQPMLDVLAGNARAASLDNVSTLHVRWEEVVVGREVQRHDVVVASRSPGMRDLAKLNDVAIKRAYVMIFAGISLKECHDELLDGIQEPPPKRAMRRGGLSPHVLVFNQLSDMGIDAQVTYVPDGFTKWYRTREDAYADFSWLAVPPDRVERFQRNLDAWLRPEGDGIRLLRETKTAIVWWAK